MVDHLDLEAMVGVLNWWRVGEEWPKEMEGCRKR